MGAVLTQNTAWSNMEKTIAGFGGDLSPQLVAGMPAEQLRDIIRPSGFFLRKADTLKTITAGIRSMIGTWAPCSNDPCPCCARSCWRCAVSAPKQ